MMNNDTSPISIILFSDEKLSDPAVPSITEPNKDPIDEPIVVPT